MEKTVLDQIEAHLSAGTSGKSKSVNGSSEKTDAAEPNTNTEKGSEDGVSPRKSATGQFVTRETRNAIVKGILDVYIVHILDKAHLYASYMQTAKKRSGDTIQALYVDIPNLALAAKPENPVQILYMNKVEAAVIPHPPLLAQIDTVTGEEFVVCIGIFTDAESRGWYTSAVVDPISKTARVYASEPPSSVGYAPDYFAEWQELLEKLRGTGKTPSDKEKVYFREQADLEHAVFSEWKDICNTGVMTTITRREAVQRVLSGSASKIVCDHFGTKKISIDARQGLNPLFDREGILDAIAVSLCAPLEQKGHVFKCGSDGCLRREKSPGEFLACSFCQVVGYCSNECRSKDKSAHGKECRRWQKIRLQQRQ